VTDQAHPGNDDLDPEDERASDVEDYTSEIPVAVPETVAAPEGVQPSGFGDGDVADVDDDDVVRPGARLSDVEIEELIAERDQLQDLAMRLQADFENFRRRTATQGATDVDRATGRLAEAFLPLLDAAEAAFIRHPDEVGPLLNLMLTELKKHGLEVVDLDSKPFDPEVADAVAHEAGDGGEVVVAEVLRTGYRWRDKTLRPAMVRTKD
jgi:molecular chaperone GrpE